jgi:hypothetical protein
MKNSISWNTASYSPLKSNRRFGGTRSFHLQDRRTRKEKNQSESSAGHLLSRWFLAWFIFLPWRWRLHVPPKRQLIFKGLHNEIMPQKIEHNSNMFVVGAGGCLMKVGLEGKPGSRLKSCFIIKLKCDCEWGTGLRGCKFTTFTALKRQPRIIML